MSRSKLFILLVLIVLAALALRLQGIQWGLPTTTHAYSYHPDENVLFSAVMNVNVLTGPFDPQFYNYGSLYIYVFNLAMLVGALAGWIDLAKVGASAHEMANVIMVGRMVALLAGLLTVYLVYRLGRKGYGTAAGLLGATLMAVLPIHVMHSKFVAVDVPATLLVTASLLYAVRLSDGHRLRDYLLAGLFAGLAAGTKYNAGLVMLSPIVVHLVTSRRRPLQRIFSAKLWSVPVMAAVGFIIGTPGVFLNYAKFRHDFVYELNHARTGHGLVFTDTGSGFVYHFMHNLPAAMGWPLLVLAIIGVLYAIYRRTAADWAMLTFLVVYYVVIGMAEIRFARYVIPFLPILALMAARVSVDALGGLLHRGAFARVAASAGMVVLVLCAATGAVYSIALNMVFDRPDTRDQAYSWIERNVPEGSSVGFPLIPSVFYPPFEPTLGFAFSAEDRFRRVESNPNYLIMVSRDSEWDDSFLRAEKPDFVVLSGMDYRDALRVKLRAAREYFAVLESDYNLGRQFEVKPPLEGYDLGYFRNLPHDMSYASPAILIYSHEFVEPGNG